MTFVDLGSDDILDGMALQDDGKIVADGATGQKSWVGRFDAEGTLDPSFGTSGGINTYDLDPFHSEQFHAVLLSPGNRIVVGGFTDQFVLARFQGDGPTAADDAYAVDEDTPLIVDAAAGVLGNDTDPQGDTLSVRLITDVDAWHVDAEQRWLVHLRAHRQLQRRR